MSHTPGPWEIMESANALVVMGADSKHVVIVPLFREYEWDKEEWGDLNLEERNRVSIANAQLIAAAPELYEALENLIDFLFHGKKNCQAILRAKAALAKARGDEGEENA